MNIGIMADGLGTKYSRTGIGMYMHETLREIAKIDRDNTFYLFSNSEIMLDFTLPDNWKVIVTPFRIRILWRISITYWLIKKYKIDAFWSPEHALPFLKVRNCRYYMTVHDVANFKLKNIEKNSKYRNFFKSVMGRSIKVADMIFAVSNATKSDLISIFDVPSDKVIVIYEGGTSVDISSATENIIVTTKEKYGIKGSYFLYVGTLQPRKNISLIFNGYCRARDKKYISSKLVLAGGVGWGMDEVLHSIKTSEYSEDVILTGYVNDEEKLVLYKGCTAFVFPSMYEGFGIPVLEAFKFGVPVILSRNSSLPEVGGTIAFYIDGNDEVEALAQKLHDISTMSKDELALISRREREWENTFSWKKCAKEVHKYLVMEVKNTR